MPDVILIASPVILLAGALLRRAVTKIRHPERHQQSIDAHRNFLAEKSMTPRQREMKRQHP